MKLILLYGPPAVGKLTIAQALQEVTGFKLLHNHLISDLALSMLERGTIPAADLNHHIRCLMYESGAKNKLPGLISTVLHRYDIKDQVHPAFRDYVRILKDYHGEVCAVHLFCDTQELMQRAINPSRIGTKKISSAEKLAEILTTEDLMRRLPDDIVQSLSIDNTYLAPGEVVRIIRSHFKI